MKLSGNTYVVVKGPCNIRIKSGHIEIFGMRLTERNFMLDIPSGKRIPIYAITEAELEAPKKCVEKIIKGKPFPDDWINAVNAIEKILGSKNNPIKVMVLGYCDVGKSSFVLYAGNKLLGRGYRVAVIDADIGQSKMGIPGIIAGGILNRQEFLLENVNAEVFYFIGDNTPTGHLLQMVVGLKKVVDNLISKVDIILIDTTGMVFDGSGRALKESEVLAIDPDIIILLEQSNELYHFEKIFSESKILRLSSPIGIKETPRAQRILNRKKKIESFFMDSQDIVLNLNKLSSKYVFILTGREIREPWKIFDESVLYSELMPDALLIITEASITLDEKYTIIEKAKKFLVALKVAFLAIKLGLKYEKIIEDRPILSALTENDIKELGNIVVRRNIEDIKIQVLKETFYNGLIVGLSSNESVFLGGIGIIRSIDFRKKEIKLAFKKIKEDKKLSKIWFGYLRYDEKFNEIKKRKVGVG